MPRSRKADMGSPPLVRPQTIIISAISVLSHCRYVTALHPTPSRANIRPVVTIPIARSSDRCTPHPTALLWPSNDASGPSRAQYPNPVYAPHLLHHIVFFVPILQKLHLLRPCPSWYAASLFCPGLNSNPLHSVRGMS